MDAPKPILDPCCASRMFYFDKQNPDVLFCDIRHGIDKPMDSGRKRLVIEPDMVADVTSLPFDDESFSLVIFDPPHLVGSHAGIMKPGLQRMLAGLEARRNLGLQMVRAQAPAQRDPRTSALRPCVRKQAPWQG